jgi:hypothetical protein
MYAAFTSDGVPCINVYDYNKKRLEALVSDRIANGDALPGEHVVRIYRSAYNKLLEKHGFPTVKS